MVLLTNLESFTLNNKCGQFDQHGIHLWHSFKDEFNRSTASENRFSFGHCGRKHYRSIVRVQYFVRGGFVGYRSRASSKHLSPHLPVDELDSSGVKKGLRCSCKMHVWVSGPQRSRLDVDVSEK
ncbi:hypothetical protein TNCV_2493331 [Trichonephila clavipes]|uniref:Uncharacterized protein n=1 Tax=Trichonephila clavipes TaxID=2585209 RepID=A0A8X6V8U4_TRICX|nr:hypothetical protein TNCV_2493331 [Trichonephila clavipes]